MSEVRQQDPSLRLGIITYDHAHLKTEQLVNRLLLKTKLSIGPKLDLKLLALPFSSRPSRRILLVHRPDQQVSIPTRELSRQNNLEFLSCTYDSIPDVADYYLVAGAGIFTAEAIGKKKIVNAHPGIIPSARGLDAFKWSIFDGVPLGVTLHYIDAAVDAGETIAVIRTPIFPSDSLETLARRHYELELDVLSEFLAFMAGGYAQPTEVFPQHPPKMRMPIDTEQVMVRRFDEYKLKYGAGPS